MTPSLDIGTVLSKTFACFQRHWLPFMLLVLVIFIPLLPANLYLIDQVETMEQMNQSQLESMDMGRDVAPDLAAEIDALEEDEQINEELKRLRDEMQSPS